ncbi:hypothetical protein ACKUSY_02465 [Myroides odoratus]
MQVNKSSDVMSKICSFFLEHASRNAFVIEGKSYNYEQLSTKVRGIYNYIILQKDKVIGIMTENCISKFFIPYFDYKITGKYKPYMRDAIDNFGKVRDSVNNSAFNPREQEIIKEGIGYWEIR